MAVVWKLLHQSRLCGSFVYAADGGGGIVLAIDRCIGYYLSKVDDKGLHLRGVASSMLAVGRFEISIQGYEYE